LNTLIYTQKKKTIYKISRWETHVHDIHSYIEQNSISKIKTNRPKMKSIKQRHFSP